VLHDLLGLSARAPKFAKAYAALAEEVTRAAEDYVHEVKSGAFPTDTHSFHSLKSVAANG
jgi:3-methyl-2-oxobutanoate hydroxymethyltransferase